MDQCIMVLHYQSNSLVIPISAKDRMRYTIKLSEFITRRKKDKIFIEGDCCFTTEGMIGFRFVQPELFEISSPGDPLFDSDRFSPSEN